MKLAGAFVWDDVNGHEEPASEWPPQLEECIFINWWMASLEILTT